MKNIFSISLIALLCLFITPTYGGDNGRVRVRIERKEVQDGERIIVHGIPITEYNPTYYYELDKLRLENDEKDALAEDIANRIADKLTKIIEDALSGLVPTNPDDGNTNNGSNNVPNEPTVEDNVVNVMRIHKCNTCHGSERHMGDVTLFNTEGKLAITLPSRSGSEVSLGESKWIIVDACETNKMPKDGEPLNIQELELLKEWARLH